MLLSRLLQERGQPKKAGVFHYGGTGYWKHDCKAVLESVKKEHRDASSSGIQIVEINTSIAIDNQTWVLDTACGFHLVSSMKRLRSNKKVNKGDIDLRSKSYCSGSRTISFMFTFRIGIILDKYYIQKYNFYILSC